MRGFHSGHPQGWKDWAGQQIWLRWPADLADVWEPGASNGGWGSKLRSYLRQEFHSGIQHGHANCQNFLEARASDIAAELGWPPPRNDDDLMRVLKHILAFAKRVGPEGAQKRWMSAFDAAEQNVKSRHTRMALLDLLSMSLSSSPHRVDDVNFSDDFDTVWKKTKNSIKAACHILRDDKLFQAFHSNKQAGCWCCLLRAVAHAWQPPLPLQGVGRYKGQASKATRPRGQG